MGIMEGRTRRGGIVWPLILIGAGIMFLLNNAGVLSWNVWWSIARLWPILLIAIGLDILIGRRSLLGSLLVAVVVLGILGAAIFAPLSQLNTANLRTEQISQGLDSANKAVLKINVGTATLAIKEGQEAAGLVQGTMMLANGERLTQNFRRNGDTAQFELGSQNAGPDGWPMGWSGPALNSKRWDLQFNPDVPIQLTLDAGVGNAQVDLSRLKISGLDVNSGVGNVDLTLPRSGQFSASMDAGVGRLHVIIPAGMAARIRVDRGLGGLDVKGNFDRSGEDYVTHGFDTATNRVEIQLNGGLGRITIDQMSEG